MTDVLYASRIARLPVLDPDGTPLGKVDDLVVGPPVAGHGPPVLGFVVTVPGRRIFVSAGRVTALEPGGLRLRSSDVNLRRFAPRPTELLVLHDLLDRPVPGVDAVVNDVGISASSARLRGWEVAVVDLVPAGRRLLGTRRRDRRTQPWEVARALFAVTADRWSHLRELHPHDVADHIRELPASDRTAAARTLDDEQLADTMEELPEDVQAQLLDALDLERAADVLEAMQPDDAADLLGELEGARRGELLAAMEPDEAEPLRRLLRYENNTAGGLMTPEPILLPPTATVAEALALVRDPDVTPALAGQVFVVQPPTEPPTGRFLGICHLQRLLREPPGAALGDCVADDGHIVGPELDEVQVAERLAAYNLLAVPVCDEGGRLLGAVTVDDVLDRVLPEGWRQR
ncbi:MAG: magnesium transporter MgtE N-terminal domain-containing protein [Egibacteraceae bacterium]